VTEPDEDDAFEGTRMSLGEHLDELRTRLIRGLAALAIAFLVCWFFRDGATDVVMRPMFQALAWIDADQVAKYELRLAADPALDRTAFFLSDDPADKTLRPELTVAPRPQALGFTEQFWFAVKVTGLFAWERKVAWETGR
jgi:Sec-independent protein secretion pathway component TatC